jgi:hypothetical protein
MLPTPTPLPPGSPMVNLTTSDWRIWSFTDEAIQVWHFYPSLGTVIQFAVLIILIVAFVALMIKLVQAYMNESDIKE